MIKENWSTHYSVYKLYDVSQKNYYLLNIVLHRFSPNTSVSLKPDSSGHRNFASTIKERNENIIRSEKERDYGYGSQFRPIDHEELGAKAIRVQDIPNGALGRPVEFESKSWFFIFSKTKCETTNIPSF